MIESFKIVAKELHRNLKIHVSLPNQYHETEKLYPAFIVLDGDLFFNFVGEETKVFHSQEMLEEIQEEAILFFLHSPTIPEWRLSELNPYYDGKNEDVDHVLSFIYFEYIHNTLFPMLLERYRINVNGVYLVGLRDAAPACIYMSYQYTLYKGMVLFDPKLTDCKDKLWEDLANRFTCKKGIYLFHGGMNTDTKEDDMFYHLATRFESLKCEKLMNDFEPNMDNSNETLEQVFSRGIHFLAK